MHSFLNKFVTTAPQSAWGQQQQQSSVQVAQPELGQNIPPGTYPPGTLINVGQHITTIESYLAEGGFAHVYLVRMNDAKEQVVLKRIAVADQDGLKSVNKEVAAMKQLNGHKNIVRYIDSQAGGMKGGGYEVFILMEFCSGGGVIDLMNRRLQNRLTESEILKIFSDVSEAVAHMHYCKPPLLHRDLKIENILITSHGSYKLSDFGSCTPSTGNSVPRTLQEIQKVEEDIQRYTTMQYRAPEMVDVYQKRPINEKADIWALGVLLYKLCYYTTPFEDQGPLAILNAKYTIPPYPAFSHDIQRLIISMLKEDAHQRPNIYQVVKSVSKMRGLDCPIRNIYPDVSVPIAPQSSQLPSVVFETPMPPPQQLPNIVPMRRGRPVRNEKGESSNQTFQKNGISEFDPFDPFDPSRPTNEATVFDGNPTTDLFSLNESTAFQTPLLSAENPSQSGFSTGNGDSLSGTTFNLSANLQQTFNPSPEFSQSTGITSSLPTSKRQLTGGDTNLGTSPLSTDTSSFPSTGASLTGSFAAMSSQPDYQPSSSTLQLSNASSTSLTANSFNYDAKRASTSVLSPAHHHTFDQITRTHSGGSNGNPWQPQQQQPQSQLQLNTASLNRISPQQTPTSRDGTPGSYTSGSSTLSSAWDSKTMSSQQLHQTPSPRSLLPASTVSPPSSSSSTQQPITVQLSSSNSSISSVETSPSSFQTARQVFSPPESSLAQPQPHKSLSQSQKPYKPVPPPKPLRFKLSSPSTAPPPAPPPKVSQNQQDFQDLNMLAPRPNLTTTVPPSSSTTSIDVFMSKFPPAEALDAHVEQQINVEILAAVKVKSPIHSQTPLPSAPTRPSRSTRSLSDN